MKGTEQRWGKTFEELNDEERFEFLVQENAYLWYLNRTRMSPPLPGTFESDRVRAEMYVQERWPNIWRKGKEAQVRSLMMARLRLR